MSIQIKILYLKQDAWAYALGRSYDTLGGRALLGFGMDAFLPAIPGNLIVMCLL